MRGLPIAAVAGLMLLALSPTASAGAWEVELMPVWPEPFERAFDDPVPLIPGPPMEETSRNPGPVLPGATTTGTEHSFRWTLINPDGSQGPAGTVDIDEEEPVKVRAFLSADALEAEKLGPLDEQVGIALDVTVDVTLRLGEESYGPKQATHTLVSTPLGAEVTRYAFSFDVDQDTLAKGEGLHVDGRVYQANASGQMVTQPFWRVHTTPQHPTGLTLSALAPTELAEDDASWEAEKASAERTQRAAVATLTGSLCVAAVAGHRMVRG